MPNFYKVLGQSNPASITATTLYTVPASRSTVVSTITVANLSATAATFRIAIRVGGAALANTQYVAYDVVLTGNEAKAFTLGITLATTDVITVYASTANVTFSAFGTEIS
jgi:hypothetical protein